MTSANQAIDPSKLSISQLQFLAKSLDEENSLLTSNFNQLKVAHAKFLDAAACATTVANTTERKDILVPLTSSLYVPGTLEPGAQLLVDIGTSFFVGKSPGDAAALLRKKAAALKDNTDSLYKVIGEKRENLDVVQDTLSLKQREAARNA